MGLGLFEGGGWGIRKKRQGMPSVNYYIFINQVIEMNDPHE